MMFLVRSAFWLSIVVAHMPLDGSETLGAVGQAKDAVVAGVVRAAQAKCGQETVACQALVTAAAGAMLAPGPARPAKVGPEPAHAAAKAKRSRPSVNSLSAADLAAPWRGRPPKSGA